MRQRAVADIPESGLSDIRNHPPPRLPSGRLKRNKIKKPPLAVKKSQIVAPSQPSPRGRRLITMGSPSPTLPKGRESLLAVFKGV